MTKMKKSNLLKKFLDTKVSKILNFLGFLIMSAVVGVCFLIIFLLVITFVSTLNEVLINSVCWIRNMIMYTIFFIIGICFTKKMIGGKND